MNNKIRNYIQYVDSLRREAHSILMQCDPETAFGVQLDRIAAILEIPPRTYFAFTFETDESLRFRINRALSHE